MDLGEGVVQILIEVMPEELSELVAALWYGAFTGYWEMFIVELHNAEITLKNQEYAQFF